MAIRNKDGTDYRLRGPNPLMKNQDQWDPKKVILHNLEWNSVVIKDDRRPQPVSPIQPSPIPPPVEVEASVPAELPLEVKTPDPEPDYELVKEPVHVTHPPVKVSTAKLNVTVHCLPAEIKVYRDDLFDEERRTISYGNKFEFDANVVERSDLKMVLWTARKGIEEGSVVYPKTQHARWWRVVDTEGAGVGYRVECEPSDYQPSF